MASTAIEVVLSKLADYCGPILIKHLRYMISPERYIKELRDALKDLDAAESRLQHRIDDATSSGYAIEIDVWQWCNDVKETEEIADKLIRSRQHSTADCCNGLVKIPRPVERHRLAKQAVDIKGKVVGHCKKVKDDLEVVSYRIHHPVGETWAIKSAFIDLPTHTKLINKVFKVLESGDDDASMIGIHGIKGVGKSALVRKIVARARESDRYDKAEIVDVNNLHTSIVNFLKKGSPGQAKDEDDPAGNKWVLLILDDPSEKIDLSRYIEETRKNLKLQFLVTSENHGLLSSMHCHPILALNALSNAEARELLTGLIGPNKAHKLGNIADEELSKRCGGLPFIIEALAQIIKRSNSSNLLEDALNQLPLNLDSVDTILDWTYKQLDDQVKFLFSLCAVLRGQTINIEHLLRYQNYVLSIY